MKPGRLQQLLREADQQQVVPRSDAADAAAAAADAAAALAARVLEANARRQRAKLNAAVAIVVVFMGLGSASLWLGSNAMRRRGQVATAANMAELNKLRAKIAEHEAVVDRMIAIERRLNERDEPLPPINDDPIERAAATAVLQADRVRNVPGLTQQALRSYNQVIEYFPQTASAQVARQRAAELKKEG